MIRLTAALSDSLPVMTPRKKLLPDGRNLVTLLNSIKNVHPICYDRIEEAIKKINPYFKDIGFSFLGSKK